MLNCFTSQNENATPIEIISKNNFSSWLNSQNESIKNWLNSTNFRGESGNLSLIPDASGKLIRVIFCVRELKELWNTGSLPFSLPEGNYFFEIPTEYLKNAILAWGLGAYQFTRYKKPTRNPARIFLAETKEIENIIESIYQVRDLINTPTEDMGPTELANAAQEIAKPYQANVSQIIGDDLLKNNFPAIHAVGRASDDFPRLIDLRWGNKKHRKITLVGKGVCFDSGGLDIKNSSGMLLMKKDMGGAAHVLGLAKMIMAANLPINLRVLIPAVENSISGNAYRPGDVIQSRKGLTIEIGNTDAEGRVVLADALAEAVSEKPDLIIDIATLTGAARVALGTDLPAMFANQEELANQLLLHAEKQSDFIWRLPLYTGYREALNSSIADINNSSADGYAGAITAALFLKEFVPDEIPWAHFDLMAWNLKNRAGRPQGGEAMALRGIFSYLSG